MLPSAISKKDPKIPSLLAGDLSGKYRFSLHNGENVLYCYYLKKEGSIMTNKNLHKKILWITTTAMLLALLITL